MMEGLPLPSCPKHVPDGVDDGPIRCPRPAAFVQPFVSARVGYARRPSAQTEASSRGACTLLCDLGQKEGRKRPEMGYSEASSPISLRISFRRASTVGECLLVRTRRHSLCEGQRLFACRPRTPTRKKSQGIDGSVG